MRDEREGEIMRLGNEITRLRAFLEDVRTNTRPLVFTAPDSAEWGQAMDWLGYMHTEWDWKQGNDNGDTQCKSQ